jgi:integrase
MTMAFLASACGRQRAGKNRMVLNYRVAGRERRLTIGAVGVWTLQAARLEAGELRRRVDRGHDPLANRLAERTAPTVVDLAARFLEDYVPTKRSYIQRDYKAIITNEILPKLGNLKVGAVTFADIERLHSKLSQRAPIHANRTLAILSRMFTLAIRWQMRADNPVRGVERNHEEPRTRYLSADELERMIAALDGYRDQSAAAFYRLLMFTGARSGETLAATWAQFDLDKAFGRSPPRIPSKKGFMSYRCRRKPSLC